MSLRAVKLALASIIIGFALATAYISAVIFERQNALRESSRYNTTWLISQAVSEFLRLEQRIAAYALRPDAEALEEVELRFDIWLNRLKLLAEGEVLEFLRNDAERLAMVRDLQISTDKLESLLLNLRDERGPERALELLAPLDTKVAALASTAHSAGAVGVDEDQQALLRLHWMYTALVVGLIACGVMLIVLLLWHNRQLEHARAALHTLSSDLKTKSRLLQTTLETIDQGLVLAHADGTIQVCNPRLFALLDLPSDSLARHNLFEIDELQLRRGDVVVHVPSVNASAGVGIKELQKADGTFVDIRTAWLADGSLVRSYSDVTARRAAELAKDNFLATVSHEIRTPLTGLLGVADLLAAENLNLTQGMYVEAVRSSGKHLLSIVNNVLDFSRIEAGKLPLETIDFGLAEVAESVRSVLAPQALERGLDLHFDLGDLKRSFLKGDPTRLAQVLMNLAGNGIKFTEHGSVYVSMDRPNGNLDRIRFEVRDTGIGIPLDKQDELFNPFVQADSSTTRRFGGSGLGLAISQRIVEAMGGRIQFASIPGIGSHFWFELSLPSGNREPSGAKRFDARRVSPRRILIAEDVELNRRLLADILGRHGHSVTFAHDGAQAVELVQAAAFDLLFMDIQMPIMDGVEATRRIRQLQHSCRSIRIFGLTANALPGQKERYIAAGMDGCLTKPIDWHELFTVIEDAGSRTSPQVPAADSAGNRGEIDQLGGYMNAGGGRPLVIRALEDAQQALARLMSSCNDPIKVAREAHSLKGTAGMFGLVAISAVAAQIEAAARERRDVCGLLRALQDAVAVTETELSPAC
jgi:signal transduction histidine kinase/CheY-like chemotaxis protein